MKILENVVYSQIAGKDGVGDLYLPDNLTENTPLALCIHGGGWSGLDKKRMNGIAVFLCRDLGLTVYNINYRLADEHKWPIGGDDCLAAAWAMLNGDIPELGSLKQKKIMVIGASSGGHYALMTGLRLPPERVSGIVSIAGINSVYEDHACTPSRYETLFGRVPTAGDLAAIDPKNFLTADSPAIFCTHDLADNVVPCQASRTLEAAANALGVDCSCYYYRKDENKISHRIFIGESVDLYKDIENAIAEFIRTKVWDYIPEPQPQKSDIEISALYYPGTEQMAEWDQVEQTMPWIKPLLGWYDEHDPEVIDWQIKWAVEHGISSFCVDWYWNRGAQRLDHWVKGFYQARFRSYLKWYVMWANHNEVGSHSTEDQKLLTRFWIENYFRTPEYYTIDGHPVVVIYSVQNLDRDFRMEAEARGEKLTPGEGVKRALEVSNGEMRKAGLPEIYFINMNHSVKCDSALTGIAKTAGFKEQMVYNFSQHDFVLAPEAAQPGDTAQHHDFNCVVAGVQKWWQLWSSGDFDPPMIPILPTGWNDQPRSFEYARVIYGRTVEKYQQMCQACRDFCDKTGQKKIIIAPLNEWQEGSYIEPNEEFGFGMYNAVRDAFCTRPPEGFPPDLLPGDAGRGPYDYPPMERPEKTSWVFSNDLQGWYRNPFGTAHLQIIDKALHCFRSGGDHAALRTRLTPFPAEKFTRFTVKMRVTLNENVTPDPDKTELVRLYFGTTGQPLIQENLHIRRAAAVSVPGFLDGKWHEYTLDLTSNPLWKEMINELWFDPPQLYSTNIDIMWMKLS